VAAKYGQMDAGRLLLLQDGDADVDVRGKNGLTSLHVATHYDQRHVVVMLLQHSADIHAHAKVSTHNYSTARLAPSLALTPLEFHQTHLRKVLYKLFTY